MPQYKEFGSELINEAYEIYRQSEWNSYLKDKEKLRRAFDSSLYILGAFEDGRLVGFVRCVGDNEFILYIQDLIVTPSFQRKGIGRELMRRVSERFSDIRQFVLITDREDKAANAFYRSIGLSPEFNGFPINTYFRTEKES